MAADFPATFAALKAVLAQYANRLAVKTDTASEYTLVTKSPSPFPQHKGQPMFFGSVKVGKAYVSYHLMPLYMNASMRKQVPPALQKRMQGKSCFHFKTEPEPELLESVSRLTKVGLEQWQEKKWA